MFIFDPPQEKLSLVKKKIYQAASGQLDRRELLNPRRTGDNRSVRIRAARFRREHMVFEAINPS